MWSTDYIFDWIRGLKLEVTSLDGHEKYTHGDIPHSHNMILTTLAWPCPDHYDMCSASWCHKHSKLYPVLLEWWSTYVASKGASIKSLGPFGDHPWDKDDSEPQNVHNKSTLTKRRTWQHSIAMLIAYLTALCFVFEGKSTLPDT